MENEPPEVNPYQDPELIEQSQGDQELLHRLVARRTAQLRLQEDPKNNTWKTMYEVMNTTVRERQRQLGIESLPEGLDPPEM